MPVQRRRRHLRLACSLCASCPLSRWLWTVEGAGWPLDSSMPWLLVFMTTDPGWRGSTWLCVHPPPAVEGRQRGRLLCRTPPAALRDPLPPTDLAPVPVVTSHPISMLGFCPGPAEKEVKPPRGSPRGVLVVSRQLGSCCQWPQPGGSPVEAGGRPSSAGKPGCSHCPAPPPILEWASQQTGTQARNQVRTGQSPRCLQRWSDTRQ